MTIREKTVALIDALKATCKTYGMGNDGNEYKIITQVFLYKFLNDKFGCPQNVKESIRCKNTHSRKVGGGLQSTYRHGTHDALGFTVARPAPLETGTSDSQPVEPAG